MVCINYLCTGYVFLIISLSVCTFGVLCKLYVCIPWHPMTRDTYLDFIYGLHTLMVNSPSAATFHDYACCLFGACKNNFSMKLIDHFMHRFGTIDRSKHTATSN